MAESREKKNIILKKEVLKMYTPLGSAKKEVWKRWKDEKLRKKVKAYLGGEIPEPFKKEPRAVLSRSVITPNMEFLYFSDLSRDAELKPVGLEGASDKFCTKNSDKVSLGKLSFYKNIKVDKNPKSVARIMNMEAWDGKKISEAKTLWGERLIDFHHRMLALYGADIEIFDDFDWFSKRNRRNGPAQYYANFLPLFLCYGILFENFHADGKEENFTSEIVLKCHQEIEKEFGLKPLIVPLVPIEDEELLRYWNSYTCK